MVSLVIVSHSATLAAGVAELARGMAGAEVQVAVAGGLNDHSLGTDAALVLEAIQQVWSAEGVLVLMDLGSAILSAEMALEMLPDEQRANVRLSAAPLVEGAVSAIVQARLGRTLEQVAAEANRALTPKQHHLDHAEPSASISAQVLSTIDAELILSVENALGLHARPAARVVQLLGQFDAQVRLQNITTNSEIVDAHSVLALSIADVRSGHTIRLTASGPQASAALESIRTLGAQNFGDVDTPTLPPTPPPTSIPAGALKGKAASGGLALGPAWIQRASTLTIPTHTITDPTTEWERLTTAIAEVRAQAEHDAQTMHQRANLQAAEIFAAHAQMLTEAILLDPARQAIIAERHNAADSWHRVTQTIAAQYRQQSNAYLRERATDIESLGQQVIAHLLNLPTISTTPTQPSILIATDLTPADTAQLDATLVLGILLARGGPTSHSAILARALGIPAIMSAGESVLDITDNTLLALDGHAGYVLVNPSTEARAEFQTRIEHEQQAHAKAQAASAALAFTRDQQRIEIAANVGSVEDARRAVAEGAEGVGLFRTEFLFLDRQIAPDEEEQYRAYRSVCEVMGQRPVVIRTLDVGGDKPLPYIDMGQEANPFLGWRAIRLCLARPDFFKVQLRAILRVAAEFPLRVMFPMIATLDEFRAAKALIGEACAELRQRDLATPDHIETGIMVEIPAAALRASHFAREVDFFSIGTNDLTQYTLAAERGNTHVADLADALHPSVLQLIQQTAQAGNTHGKWTGICGELGGDPVAVPLLVGLGVTELSMAPKAIPQAKQIVRGLTMNAARTRALTALTLESAAAVRAALR